MPVSQLTRKSVQLALKKGWCLEDFVVKYESTEEEVKDRIRSLYNHGEADGFIKEIERNKGKNGGPKPRKKTPAADEAPEREPDTVVVFIDPELKSEKTEKTESLDELQAKESELSSEVMELETQHVAIANIRKDIAKAIREQQEKIREILKNCSTLVAEANARGEEMNKLSSTIAEKRAVLEGVRKKISEMKHIVLCVYQDGKIAPYDEGRQFDLNDYGFDALFLGLAQNEECSKLTIAEVKTLCRMFKIEQNSEGYTIEWVCENPELERVYKVISASPTTE